MNQRQSFGAAFPYTQNKRLKGGEMHGQSAGQKNRAGKRNVPAGAEVG